MAGQRLDHRAPQQVVLRQLDAAPHRQAPLVERGVVLLECLVVLVVGRPDAADRRHAEADQVAFRMRRVALEVALQPPLALRHREFVVRLGEVVHADVQVARARQAADGERQDVELGLGRRQLGLADAALRPEQARQVRVVVERHRGRAPDRAPCRAWPRSSPASASAGRRSGRGSPSESHCARASWITRRVTSSLWMRCTACWTAASKSCTPIETRLKPRPARKAMRPASTRRGSTSIEHSQSGSRSNCASQHRGQLGHLFAVEEGRRAAAPVQLADAPVLAQQRADAGDFLAEALDILRRSSRGRA